jgi:hexulose-6-phosphate isomerase
VKKGICYGSVPGQTPREKLELCKEAGLQGVEIPTFETQEQTLEVKAAADDLGIEIHSVMGGIHWQCPLSSTDEETRQKGVAGIQHAVRVAAWAGADDVLVVPGVCTEDDSYGACWDISIRSLKEILPTAEEHGIMLLVENVWNKFLLSPLEMRDYIDSFEHELVAAYFDVGNILLYGFPHHWIETLGKRIKKVHVKDFHNGSRQFVGLLTGSVDYPRVVSALKGIGYKDYLTAELSPYSQYPRQFVLDTGKHLQCIIEG